MQRVFESTPAPLSRNNPDLAGTLEQIVDRAMTRNVNARYQTAAELAADLQRFLDGRGIPDRSVSIAPRDDAAVPSVKPEWSVRVGGVRALAADPTGRFIAVGLASGAIELRDAQTGALIESLPIGHGAITALTITADGRAAASCDDGTIVCVRFAASRG